MKILIIIFLKKWICMIVGLLIIGILLLMIGLTSNEFTLLSILLSSLLFASAAVIAAFRYRKVSNK
ncbi:hypothetical protein [Halalkalibacter krulwichiae]|nr:hypothetical protein [Halalkalibacter krulwichiae]